MDLDYFQARTSATRLLHLYFIMTYAYRKLDQPKKPDEPKDLY